MVCHDVKINAMNSISVTHELPTYEEQRVAAIRDSHGTHAWHTLLASSAYSPAWINEPWRRALCNSLRKQNKPPAKNTTLSASALSIKSGRNVCSINNARMPSKT